MLNSPGRLRCPLNCPLTFSPYTSTTHQRHSWSSKTPPFTLILDSWLAFLYLRCESVTVVNVMPPPGQIYNNNNNTGQPPPLPCHLCSQSLSTTFISLPTFNVPQDEEKLGTLDSIINLKNFRLPSEFR